MKNTDSCETSELEKTPIIGLLTEDERRPEAATKDVLRPLPASNIEECRELLERQRTCDRFDEIDQALAVPDPPQKRSDRETSNVLKILDQLERGNG